ncbi:hypothetical protein PRZ48_007332 [Zasmidium cellare]|uniref:Uncharacterized protein n=1 Tax=Zasmidium cellare TaxID=395010 RepID=A0ABR0EK60_ZASCE|nr:hypothetical protein PRZ48_007332 [Zasmidium cellare]
MKTDFNNNKERRGSAMPPSDEQATQSLNITSNNQQDGAQPNTEAGPLTSRHGRRPTLTPIQIQQCQNSSMPTEDATPKLRRSKRKSPTDEEHHSNSPKKAKVESPASANVKGRWKGKAKETMSPTRTQPSRCVKRPASPKASPARTARKAGCQPESSRTAAKRGGTAQNKQQDGTQQDVVQRDDIQQNTAAQHNVPAQPIAAPFQQNALPQQNAAARPPTPNRANRPRTPMGRRARRAPGAAAPMAPAPPPVVAPPPMPPAVPSPAPTPAGPPGFNRECGHHERCYAHPPWEFICDNCDRGVCRRHKDECGGEPTTCSRNRNARTRRR